MSSERIAGGDVVEARLVLSGEIIVHAHVLDNTDGTYTVSYVPDRVTPRQFLHVSVNGTRVQGSPFQPHIEAGTVVASQCTASGPSLYDGVAGLPICFRVQARDKNGNGRTIGGDLFMLHLTGTEAACVEYGETFARFSHHGQSTDLGDGSYEISWSVDLPGEYSVAVTLDRSPIRGSPFRCFVASPFVRPPPTILPSLIEPSKEAVENLVELPAESVRGSAVTLIDGQLVVASTMLQTRAVSTRHPSMHCGQFAAQYAHEKQYIKHTAEGVPECRWRGVLMPHYLDDVGVHHLAAADGEVYVLSQSGGPQAPLDRIRSAPVLGGGDATPPVSFDTLRDEGDAPAVTTGFCLLHAAPLPTLSPAEAEVGDAPPLQPVPSMASQASMAPTEGEEPEEPEQEVMVIPTSEAIWLFGGADAQGTLIGDACRYDIADQCWSVAVAGGVHGGWDSRRTCAAVAADGEQRLWIFGGRTYSGCTNDIVCFDLRSWLWTVPQLAGEPPAACEKHSFTFTLDRFLVVVGGLAADATPVDAVGIVDIETMTWYTRACSPPLRRVGHAAGYACGSLYIYGGTDGAAPVSAIAKLKCASFPQQSALSFDGDPAKYLVAKVRALPVARCL